MRKRNEERHTKKWTLRRLIFFAMLLLFEIFAVFWLLFHEKQPIVSAGFVLFGVLPTLSTLLTLWRKYQKEDYLELIEDDIKEDNRLREELGMGYDIWKATTLPNIVKKEKKGE